MTVTASSGQLRVYDFHQLRLGCYANAPLTNALAARFGSFAWADSGDCDVRFDYSTESENAAPATREDARVVYESPMGRVLYSETADRLSISSKWPIRAECDPSAGRTTIRVRGPVEEHLWALSHPMLTIPFIETLKRRDRFSIHAAGVALGGKGMLIPGSSGSGKSTLALALARAGFGFLGDDMLFLVESGERLCALAFPEAFDLTDETRGLFPELADIFAGDRQPGWPKRQIRAEQRYGAEIVWDCRPVLLVFPRVAHAKRSILTAMDRREALLDILPNILLTEPASSQRHLDALSQLVSSCACYRLDTGTDLVELCERLRDLLGSAP